MEFLGSWVIGITAAALILSAVLALAPEGSAKRVVRLAGGACVLLAVFLPIAGLDADDFLPAAYAAPDEYAETMGELERTNYELQKTIIEQRISSYIQAKADALGISAAPTVSFGERDGVPFPTAVVLDCSGGESAADELRGYVEQELGIECAARTEKELTP